MSRFNWAGRQPSKPRRICITMATSSRQQHMALIRLPVAKNSVSTRIDTATSQQSPSGPTIRFNGKDDLHYPAYLYPFTFKNLRMVPKVTHLNPTKVVDLGVRLTLVGAQDAIGSAG